MEDGLIVLEQEIGLKEIARIVEQTARWVAPETFKLLPVWYPEYARRQFFFKGNWAEPQLNKSRVTGQSSHKQEGNVHANKALCEALGISKQERPNWTCCHIWGRDDLKFQNSNTVVTDNRFFSCVGNMLLLPGPLKAFTDLMPRLKTMLRVCASHLYAWRCDTEDTRAELMAVDTFNEWDSYPKTWPSNTHPERRPLGVVELNDKIRNRAEVRKASIKRALKEAGPEYPRERVRKALAYWNVALD